MQISVHGADQRFSERSPRIRLFAAQFRLCQHMLPHLRYAGCLSRMERHSEVLAELELGRRLDSVSPTSNGFRAMVLFRARRFDDAIGAARQALDLEPVFVNALWWQGMSYAGKLHRSDRLPDEGRPDKPTIHCSALSGGHFYGLAGERSKSPSGYAAFQSLLRLGTARKSTKYEQIRGARDLNPNILGHAEATG